MKKNNIKDSIWNALGLTLNSFNSFFFLLAVRYINGLDIAGIFTYAFAVCALLYFVSTYFNRSFQVSTSDKDFSFNDYLSCRLILSIVTILVLILFSIINQFSNLEILILLSLLSFRLIESISDCFYGAIHKHSKLYQTGISLSIKAILGLAAFVIVDYFTHNLPLAIASITIINLLIFFIYDYRAYRKLALDKITFTTKNLKKLLKTCFPIFFFSALSLFLVNCQKYVMPYFESDEAQTIFGILIMPATIVSLAGSYLVNPILNTATEHFKAHNFKAYILLTKKILSLLVAFAAFATGFCYFFGIPILNFIYNLDLSNYQLQLVLVIVAAAFFAAAMIISNLLTVIGVTAKQSYLYIFVSLISLFISVPFIQFFGISGAIYAFAISGLLLIISYIVLLQWSLHKFRSAS